MLLQDLLRGSLVFKTARDTKFFLDFLHEELQRHPDLVLVKQKNLWREPKPPQLSEQQHRLA